MIILANEMRDSQKCRGMSTLFSRSPDGLAPTLPATFVQLAGTHCFPTNVECLLCGNLSIFFSHVKSKVFTCDKS
jgi:hypothetical protein